MPCKYHVQVVASIIRQVEIEVDENPLGSREVITLAIEDFKKQYGSDYDRIGVSDISGPLKA